MKSPSIQDSYGPPVGSKWPHLLVYFDKTGGTNKQTLCFVTHIKLELLANRKHIHFFTENVTHIIRS